MILSACTGLYRPVSFLSYNFISIDKSKLYCCPLVDSLCLSRTVLPVVLLSIADCCNFLLFLKISKHANGSEKSFIDYWESLKVFGSHRCTPKTVVNSPSIILHDNSASMCNLFKLLTDRLTAGVTTTAKTSILHKSFVRRALFLCYLCASHSITVIWGTGYTLGDDYSYSQYS